MNINTPTVTLDEYLELWAWNVNNGFVTPPPLAFHDDAETAAVSALTPSPVLMDEDVEAVSWSSVARRLNFDA